MKKLLILLLANASIFASGDLQFKLEAEAEVTEDRDAPSEKLQWRGRELTLEEATLFKFYDLASKPETTVEEMETFLAGNPEIDINTPSTTIFKGYTGLHFACLAGNKGVSKLLIDKGTLLTERGGKNTTTPLVIAAQKGHDALCSLIIEKEPAVVKEEQLFNALSAAVENGHDEVTGTLIALSALSNEGYRKLLHKAAQAGQAGVIRMLRDLRVPITNDPELLFDAACGGLVDLCKELLDMGVDVNSPCGTGVLLMTPLYIAEDQFQLRQLPKHAAVIKLLKERGGKAELVDNPNSDMIKLEKLVTILGYAARGKALYDKFMNACCCFGNRKKKSE